MSYDKMRIARQLRLDEGERLFPYLDTAGVITIGVGRNLEGKGISESESAHLLSNDINDAYIESRLYIPNFTQLSGPRKETIVNMMFNLGWPRLKGFRRMLAALEDLDFEGVAREMLDSKWALQVGMRALRLADIMRTGHYE